jgi:hypothetical protein
MLAPPRQKDSAIPIERPTPTTVSEVEKHNRAVCQKGAVRARCRTSCQRCPNRKDFAPHDVRRRGLRLVVEDTVLGAPCVQRVTVWLARWRCCKCRYLFTDYPDFRTPV